MWHFRSWSDVSVRSNNCDCPSSARNCIWKKFFISTTITIAVITIKDTGSNTPNGAIALLQELAVFRIGNASSKTEGDGTIPSSLAAATLLASKKDCCPPSLTMLGKTESPLRTDWAKAPGGLATLTFCEATNTKTLPHNNHKFFGPSWPSTLEVGDQDAPPLDCHVGK